MNILCKLRGHKINTLWGSSLRVKNKDFDVLPYRDIDFRYLSCSRCKKEIEPVYVFYERGLKDLIRSITGKDEFEVLYRNQFLK